MKKITAIVLGIVVVLLVTGFVVEKRTAGVEALYDKFIAGADMDIYYVKTYSNPEKAGGDNYKYIFIGYNKDGKEQKIVKIIDRKLKSDAYLQIYSEGSYGKGWVEVKSDEVPQLAKEKLK